ncbi:hypothetical protein M569_14865, partial [Genlisea aurea]
CGIGLVFSLLMVRNRYSLIQAEDSAHALRTIWSIEAPVVILVYSLFRIDPNRCSYTKAIARGLLCLPFGAFLNAFGAIVLGAPVGIQQFSKTLHWSLLMSVFTFVPAGCICGSSWNDWIRIFARSKWNGVADFMVCIPAHGAVIGAWFGAWPMPLDWERPWQEWPVCVSYGGVIGYVLGM